MISEKKKSSKSRFYWSVPKNAADYFSPAYDDKFKKAHPFAYGGMVLLGIVALFGPVAGWIVYSMIINPAPNSFWLMLGWAGAFSIGIALFNIVAAILKQYLGHYVTLGCSTFGVLLIYLAILILY